MFGVRKICEEGNLAGVTGVQGKQEQQYAISLYTEIIIYEVYP